MTAAPVTGDPTRHATFAELPGPFRETRTSPNGHVLFLIDLRGRSLADRQMSVERSCGSDRTIEPTVKVRALAPRLAPSSVSAAAWDRDGHLHVVLR